MPEGKKAGEGASEGASVNVPVGEWVDVPQGMVMAEGTYVDDHGVLRSSGDHSCVVWHNKGCEKKGIQPQEIVYDVNKAPWCPECYMKWEGEREKNRIAALFGAAGITEASKN